MCRSIPVRTLNFAAISGHITKYVKKKAKEEEEKEEEEEEED